MLLKKAGSHSSDPGDSPLAPVPAAHEGEVKAASRADLAVGPAWCCSFPGAKSVSDGGNLAVQSRGTTSPLKTVAKLSHLWVSGASWGQATAWG